MASFGTRSNNNLSTCHEDLQTILRMAILYIDFGVHEGHRGEELQNRYYHEGKSTLKFPDGKHNNNPSLAVDICPWIPGMGWDWNDVARFHRIVFFIRGIALGMGIKVILGCDWDSDFYCKDHKLHDAPHIELHSKLVDGEWVKYK